jgi:hypothetical protein
VARTAAVGAGSGMGAADGSSTGGGATGAGSGAAAGAGVATRAFGASSFVSRRNIAPPSSQKNAAPPTTTTTRAVMSVVFPLWERNLDRRRANGAADIGRLCGIEFGFYTSGKRPWGRPASSREPGKVAQPLRASDSHEHAMPGRSGASPIRFAAVGRRRTSPAKICSYARTSPPSPKAAFRPFRPSSPKKRKGDPVQDRPSKSETL